MPIDPTERPGDLGLDRRGGAVSHDRYDMLVMQGRIRATGPPSTDPGVPSSPTIRSCKGVMVSSRIWSLFARVSLALVLVAFGAEARADWAPDEFPCGTGADGLTGYVGQGTCYGSPQPGVAAFREMILDAFPETTDLGIMRGCSVGGLSEHKEGRAWDWGVKVWVPAQKAIAEGVLAALLDTDDCGNQYALARRLGVMYMIWNQKIWRSYKAWLGWAPYGGSNPHTDHVHFSFSWPGALMETSYWTDVALPPGEEDQPVCTPAVVAGAEGEFFKDMPPGAFGYQAALLLKDAGITNGCSNDPKLFCPSCPAARYQAVVFLLRAMGVDVGHGPATPSFDDVPADVWWYPYVEKAKELGLTSGCGDTEFCPHDATTRAQMAKFVVQAAGWTLQNPATPTFGDVAQSAWYYKSVETIKAHCVTNGCGDGVNYCPDDTLTRAQAAIFIARAFDLGNLNPCIDYCDPSTCADGTWCEGWSACSGFSDQCDENGTRTRTCHDFEDCHAGSLDPGCGETSWNETDACTRDTDGAVVAAWGSWSAPCAGFDDICDETGSQSRTRTVCGGGASVVETETQACEVDTDGVVVSTWSDWSACGGFDDACDETGTQSRTRTVCGGGASVLEAATQACEVDTDGVVVAAWSDWGACDGFDDPCDTTGTRVRQRTRCADGILAEESQSEACVRETDCGAGSTGDVDGSGDLSQEDATTAGDGPSPDGSTSADTSVPALAESHGGRASSTGCLAASGRAGHATWALLLLWLLFRRRGSPEAGRITQVLLG